jgi:hypothetical protein
VRQPGLPQGYPRSCWSSWLTGPSREAYPRSALQAPALGGPDPVEPSSLTVGVLFGATWTPAFTSTLISEWRASASFVRAKVSM